MRISYDKIWQDVWGDMQKYGPIHRQHRRLFVQLLKNLKIESIMDVGCGEGSNLVFLKSLFPEAKLFGIDVSEEALVQTKNVLPEADFQLLDMQKDLLPQKFDLVFSSDVVEHVPDDQAMINNMFKMCDKYCLIATVQGRMRDFEKDIGHVRNYKVGELAEKMKRAGFKDVKVLEWGWPLYSPLYRNLLNLLPSSVTSGKFSFGKKMISHVLYYLFLINSSKKGDLVIAMGKVK